MSLIERNSEYFSKIRQTALPMSFSLIGAVVGSTIKHDFPPIVNAIFSSMALDLPFWNAFEYVPENVDNRKIRLWEPRLCHLIFSIGSILSIAYLYFSPPSDPDFLDTIPRFHANVRAGLSIYYSQVLYFAPGPFGGLNNIEKIARHLANICSNAAAATGFYYGWKSDTFFSLGLFNGWFVGKIIQKIWNSRMQARSLIRPRMLSRRMSV